MTALSIQDLSKAFGTVHVLQGVSIDVQPGAFFTLLGPSGCGKTTLLRAIAGFNDPDCGRILFDAEDVTRLPAHRRDIGMVFQDYALFPDKTVFDNVAYGLRARSVAGDRVRRRVGEYLERVGLGQHGARYPAELSGGQRQRVALARSLVIKPRILLMDEPLSNLDAKLRIDMRLTIRELQRASGITTIFVTHDQDEALSLSDSIAIMNRGRVAQVGTPEELYDAPVDGYVADFIGGANVVPVAIAAESDSGLEVRIGDITLQAQDARRTPTPSGHLILRPERLRLVRTDAASQDGALLPVGVEARQFLGSRTIYGVPLSNGTRLAVEDHAEQGDRFSTGDAALLVVPTTCRVVSA